MNTFKKYLNIIQEMKVMPGLKDKIKNIPGLKDKIKDIKMPINHKEIEIDNNFKISFRALVSKLDKTDKDGPKLDKTDKDGPLTINCTIKKDNKEIDINNSYMPLLYTEFSMSKQLAENNMKILKKKLEDYPELYYLIYKYIEKIIKNKEDVKVDYLEEGSILTFHKNENDWTLSHPDEMMNDDMY